MPLFDLSLAELERYAPTRDEPPDFDNFWRMTLDEARRHPLQACFTPAEAGLATLEVFDVSFNGFGGQAIKGWLLLPRGRAPGLPCLVEYLGYGGGRGFPHEWLLWSSAGYAHVVMDTRGQGSDGRTGDTPDHDPAVTGPHFPGFMTRGILDPATYYYRRVMTDAARAIEAARSHPAVDPDRVGVIGRSQGGGLALAAAALDPTVSLMAADVPFLCHYRRATHLVVSDPYAEIANYCRTHREKVETVFRTLAYFDGVNFAARCRAPALFSAGLMDTICPPSTVYAAYNHYAGPKRIETWEYNSHDGGGPHHVQTRLGFFRDVWGLRNLSGKNHQ